jgi:hypothetical protein
MGGTNLIKRLVRWTANTEKLEAIIEGQSDTNAKLGDALGYTIVELLRAEADLEYAKAVLYAIATDPHVNSRDDMIDLAFDTWLDLDGQ